MREAVSFCRTCPGTCGVRLTIDDDERLVKVVGDRQSPLSRGYICVKGRKGDVENGDRRLLHPLKRQADGSFQPIDSEQALDEIAARVDTIIRRDGPDAMACYRGTPHFSRAAPFHMLPAWMDAIGSTSFFSTLTIDQSAKVVCADRMGTWAAGKPRFHDADLWLWAGTNLPVSLGLSLGSIASNPALQLRAAKARGLRMIVIDPRRTELAAQADLHLQPHPGEDPTVAAGLLRIILSEGWEDREFCRLHVSGLEELRTAVAPFTPDYVEKRADVSAADLYRAARMFALESRKGVASTGTGPDMAARSNLSEHLYECLNVLCGRYLQEGDRVWSVHPLGPRPEVRAEVVPPRRSWETGPKSRVRGTGRILGEMLSGAMADEILTPGKGQIKGMIVAAGNPVAALPDVRKTVRAFRSLELLVSIDPFMTATSKYAHYILPTTTQYEHADITYAFPAPFLEPFSQYTPAIVKPPHGADVVDDWYPFWALAKRLGKPLAYAGVSLGFDRAPTTDELIDILTRHAQVPLDELKASPSGRVYAIDATVGPGRPEAAAARFEVAPADVVADVRDVAAEPVDGDVAADGTRFTHRLISRRMRNVVNSVLQGSPSIRSHTPYNPAWIHPDDLARHGLSDGDKISIVSENGRIPAIVESDATVKPGVVSMTHSWGGMPDEDQDYEEVGSSTNLLVSSDNHIEPINAMPRFSAIPVRLEPHK
ncbi:molybdopterin-containing oxidoreductase family protein [Streptomyces sp. NPDC002643]